MICFFKVPETILFRENLVSAAQPQDVDQNPRQCLQGLGGQSHGVEFTFTLSQLGQARRGSIESA